MSKETTTDPETTEENTGTPEPSPAPQLALNDLSAAIQIIDVAASRGAFKGEELSQVGGVRDRLSLFLNASAPPQEKTEKTEESDESEESTVEETSTDDD